MIFFCFPKIVHNGKNVGGAYRRHEGEGDESHEANINVSSYLNYQFGYFLSSYLNYQFGYFLSSFLNVKFGYFEFLPKCPIRLFFKVLKCPTCSVLPSEN
jgi:hypothetical protein